jgi:serine protease AprX
MPTFIPNYPASRPGQITLLPTPERTGALPQFTGRDVVIAFLDSGFYAHPDLGDRVLIHIDATTNDIREGTAIDTAREYSWHGQMTSVIAAGDGRTSGGRFRGIASGARLVLIKVMNARHEVKEADILRGLIWLAANHARFGVRVVNLSIGGDYPSNDPAHPIYQVLKSLADEGITIVAAAGNRPVDHVLPPASSPHVITVGGIDDHNTHDRPRWTRYHSSYGTAYDGRRKPDLSAPAQWIASPILPATQVAQEAHLLAPLLIPRTARSAHAALRRTIRRQRAILSETFGIRGVELGPLLPNLDDRVQTVLQERIHAHKLIDAHHQHVEGTSVAAAIVTSIVAQVIEARPDLSPGQVRAVLTTTADPLPGVSLREQGAGVIRPAEAVYAALNFEVKP